MGENGPNIRLTPPPPREPPAPDRFPKDSRVKITLRKRIPFSELVLPPAERHESASAQKPQFGTVVTPLGKDAYVRLDDGTEAVFFEDEMEILKDGSSADSD